IPALDISPFQCNNGKPARSGLTISTCKLDHGPQHVLPRGHDLHPTGATVSFLAWDGEGITIPPTIWFGPTDELKGHVNGPGSWALRGGGMHTEACGHRCGSASVPRLAANASLRRRHVGAHPSQKGCCCFFEFAML